LPFASLVCEDEDPVVQFVRIYDQQDWALSVFIGPCCILLAEYSSSLSPTFLSWYIF
jgi:hypothetical protein